MSKGYSLHIGLNKIDDQHYPGVPHLNAAVNDAVFWEQYARGLGYETASLHDEAATDNAVLAALDKYAKALQPGDILLLTYAGHGGQLENEKTEGFDGERYDQTWCLYNRQLLDDELFEAFRQFGEGTRILVVSDSCHSGTMLRDPGGEDLSALLTKGLERSAGSRGMRSRELPTSVKNKVKKEGYKKVQDKFIFQPQASDVKASVKLLAACQDDQTTYDGVKNGVFTEAFIHLFNEGTSLNAEKLIGEIRTRYYFPRPNFFEYGGIIPSFDEAFPFRIDIPNAAKVTGVREPDLSAVPVNNEEDSWETRRINRNAILLLEGDVDELDAGNHIEILESRQGSLVVELQNTAHEHGWVAAHALQQELAAKGKKVNVEPLLSVNPAQDKRPTREGDINNPNYITEWPPAQDGSGKIGWHLDDDHSQLHKAQRAVLHEKPDAHVRVGHLDTGYVEGHIALPSGLNKAAGRSFVSKEDSTKAVDISESGQDGHGLGTISLLAGNKVAKEHTFDEYEGFIGGVPFAEVIPMRISDSVVIMNAKNFADAIDYAIEKKCEVITMSMAGKPSNRMARAVNDAYENGIVIVSAASNCWYKGVGALLPKCVMFPAAFERVIAATGAMFDHQPYDVQFIRDEHKQRAISTQYMQGSWGPASRMTRALAAYTPNTPWASTRIPFLRSGGGTSSATPQIAAAAALWIARHRNELEAKGYYKPGRQWLKVEAVRHALYTSAAQDKVFPEWKKYYGNGILRAYDALQVGVADEKDLKMSPEAESSFFGVVETVSSFFKNRKLFRSGTPSPELTSLATELLHLLQTDPKFYPIFSSLDLNDPVAVRAVIEDKDFQEKVLQSPYASNYLKEAMIQ